MPRLDFHLTRASDGAPVTGANYRGQVVILYFGYTHCPDICPTTLANLAGMLGKVGSNECAGAVRHGRSRTATRCRC